MTTTDAIEAIAAVESVRERFMKGGIPSDELLLHFEPIVMGFTTQPEFQAKARVIVNTIELLLFTRNEPARSDLIGEQLQAAIALISATSVTSVDSAPGET